MPFDDVTVAREALRRDRERLPARGRQREGLGRRARRARAAGARLVSRAPRPARRRGRPSGPRGVRIDSRERRAGRAVRRPAPASARTAASTPAQALAAGAWGVLVAPEHAPRRRGAPSRPVGVVLAHPDPLAALQALARAVARASSRGRRAGSWRSPARPARPRPRTSSPRCSRPALRTVASPANLNTEIGLPLAILAAPAGTRRSCSRWRCAGAGRSRS